MRYFRKRLYLAAALTLISCTLNAKEVTDNKKATSAKKTTPKITWAYAAYVNETLPTCPKNMAGGVWFYLETTGNLLGGSIYIYDTDPERKVRKSPAVYPITDKSFRKNRIAHAICVTAPENEKWTNLSEYRINLDG